MTNMLAKVKGVSFIAVGLIWLIAVFVKSYPTISLSTSSAFLFFLSTVCGFGVMSIGTSLLENNTKK